MKKKDYIGKVIFELYKFKADSATISHFERLLNEITPDVFEKQVIPKDAQNANK